MPITSVRDNENNKQKKQTNKQRQKGTRGRSWSERVRAKYVVVHLS